MIHLNGQPSEYASNGVYHNGALARGAVTKRFRIACLSTHPIQYHAPLFRILAKHPALDPMVYFLTSLDGGFDPGFGVRVKWDVPLLEGYPHEFIPCLGRQSGLTFWRPWTYGLSRRLRAGRYEALLIHGYAHRALLWAIVAARMAGIHVLLRGDSQLAAEPRDKLRLAVKRKLLPKLFAFISSFPASGTLNREYYLRYGVPAERIFPMPFAVDNAYFRDGAERASHSREQLRAELGLEKSRPVILYASKLQAHKRPGDLIEAYAELASRFAGRPHAYLLFVGDGEQRRALEMRAGEVARESIRFLGFRNQSELPALFDLADVFVLTSEFEPWGLIVNEVMNAGRPVIVSDRVGAAPDLIEEGVNGFTYPVGDVAALADRIGRVLTDPATTDAMGRASQKKIADFSFEKNADMLVVALDELRSRNRR